MTPQQSRRAGRPCGPACPHCQFKTGGSGRASARRDGSFSCAVCGNVWRELGGTGWDPAKSASTPAYPVRPDETAAEKPETAAQARVSARQAGGTASPKHAGLLFGIALLCAALSGGLIAALIAAPQAETGLALTVTNASQYNRDGRIAVRVEGRIENRSEKAAALAEIEIVLAQHQGHRFYRWRYHPAINQLEPGASLRFTTADGNVPQPASQVEIGHGHAIAARPL